MSLASYELDALRAAAYWTLSGSYLWRIKDIFALRGQALYAGLRLQDLNGVDQYRPPDHGGYDPQ